MKKQGKNDNAKKKRIENETTAELERSYGRKEWQGLGSTVSVGDICANGMGEASEKVSM